MNVVFITIPNIVSLVFIYFYNFEYDKIRTIKINGSYTSKLIRGLKIERFQWRPI